MSREDRLRRLGLDGLDDEARKKALDDEAAKRAADEATWEAERKRLQAARKKKRPPAK